MVNITNFTVVLLEDPRHQDTFQLTDDTRGEMTHSESVSQSVLVVTAVP